MSWFISVLCLDLSLLVSVLVLVFLFLYSRLMKVLLCLFRCV